MSKFKEFFDALSVPEKEQLATDADTSVAYLYQIANGYRNAGWTTIQKLLKANSAISISMFEQQAT